MKKQGFTLVELMVVIAIIGILAGVVLVSSQTSVDKAKRSSALTSAASAMAEIVTCEDDGGNILAYAGTGSGVSQKICNSTTHAAVWPDITSSGWTYSVPASASPVDDTFVYKVTKASNTTVCCSMAKNSCYDADASGNC